MQRRYLSIYFLPSTPSPHAPLDLRALALFCKRYTPLVSLDEPFGIVLDTTGCEALFKGERALLMRVKNDMQALGHLVQTALAPTPLCARAMARFRPNVVIQPTDLPQALYQLPIEALELGTHAEHTLHELGIRRLLELFRLPRAQLLTRFGQDVIHRMDAARGEREEPRIFEPEKHDWFIQEHLSDTIRDSSYLCEAVLDILQRLCLALSKEGLGLQKLELGLTHLDRTQSQIDVGVVKPSADAAKLFRLLNLKLERFDAGLGVEVLIIRAKQIKKLVPQKLTLSYEDISCETDLSVLFDTLINRVGEKNVFQLLPHESHIPEKAYQEAQVDNHKVISKLLIRDIHKDTVRPIRIFKQPEPIEVIAMLPDSPPRRIVWRKHFVFHVKKADGPERIESEWWLNNNTETRDYYCVEDNRGLRLWVFKQMLAEHPAVNWYIHGLLA